MTDVTLSREWLNFNSEDYTECVCLLLPKRQATLIDADCFEWAIKFNWQCLGRSVFYITKTPVIYWSLPWKGGKRQRKRLPATTTMHSLHRAVMAISLRESDPWNVDQRMRKRHVDHINRNPWDNRKANLRLATASQNLHNRPGHVGKSSRYKGVSRDGNKWRALAKVKGKLYRLGTFDDEVSAAIAYNRFVEEMVGEFAYLNPISTSPDDEPFTPARKPRRWRKKKVPAPVEYPPMTGLEAFRMAMLAEKERQARKKKPAAMPSDNT